MHSALPGTSSSMDVRFLLQGSPALPGMPPLASGGLWSGPRTRIPGLSLLRERDHARLASVPPVRRHQRASEEASNDEELKWAHQFPSQTPLPLSDTSFPSLPPLALLIFNLGLAHLSLPPSLSNPRPGICPPALHSGSPQQGPRTSVFSDL